MTTPRLDAPFAASRQYGSNPLTLAFDILTLPLQISNVLTGIPPFAVPSFTSEPTPPLTPTPAPTGGGGIEGSFGIVGLSPMQGGLGLQTITVGAQAFSAVRVSWSGQIKNVGNAPLSDAIARLEVIYPESVLRDRVVQLATINPGGVVPLALSLDVLSSDPPGSFMGRLVVLRAGQVLGQLVSPILGTVNPFAGISIEGTFGV